MDQHQSVAEQDQNTRLREAIALSKGQAGIDAGRTMSLEAVTAWLKALDKNPHAPMPEPD